MQQKSILTAIAIMFILAILPATAEQPKPGEKFYHCDDCPHMIVLPAGSFRMGSPAGEEGRGDSEGPVRTVTINHSFAVGVFEVTFNEWDYCVRQGGCPRPDDDDKKYLADDEGWGRADRPVINVSWYDAKAYVKWLSQHTGKPYRLLTEAEWEYAARSGSTTPFYFGNTISTEQANYNGNDTYGAGQKGEYRKQTIATGVLPPNDFGLHDMHGNVWEWVEDCWHATYQGAPTDGSAWIRRDDCHKRVVRGGSWDSEPESLRSANRYWVAADFRGRNTGSCVDVNWDGCGFRVAMTLSP